MKRFFYFIPAVLVAAAVFFACDNFKSNNKEVTSIVLNQPHCKNHHSTKAGDENKITNGMSVIKYSYDVKRGILTIKHINAGFNCCPGSLSISPDVSKSSIVITEKESAQGCKCLCLYDFEYAITGVSLWKYKVEIKEPYLGSQDSHIFEIDLNASTTGQHIAARTEYPWEAPEIAPQ